MTHKYWFPLVILILLLAACTPPPPTPNPEDPNATAMPSPTGGTEPLNPYTPGKGDESLTRGDVYIDSTDLLTLESFPLQFQLHVAGSLPTPCHELRVVVDEPNAQAEIHVEIYSVFDPSKVCAQVLEPFDVNIPLGSPSGGPFTVFVNGTEVGKITPSYP